MQLDTIDAMPAMPGMNIKTTTDLVKKAREGVMDLYSSITRWIARFAIRAGSASCKIRATLEGDRLEVHAAPRARSRI